MIEALIQDLRHGARMLRKSPGFASIAIVSIAIGVGANAAMFSIADGLILRPLAVPNADEVVIVSATTPTGDVESDGVSYPDYLDLRDRTRSFDGLFAVRDLVASFDVRPGEPAFGKFGQAVSGNLFDVIGVRAALGRTFSAAEDAVPGRDPVMVLAHDTWTQLFAADPAIIGRQVRVGGEALTVIGVMPASFTGLDHYVPVTFYVPLAMLPRLGGAAPPDVLARRDLRTLMVMGRLEDGVTLPQAQDDVRLIASALQQTYPDTNRGHAFQVETYLGARMREYAPAAGLAVMLLLLAIAVLLVACANVAGLLTSRNPVRAREIALRLAIGGSRLRLVRQFVTESLLIGLCGSVLGLAVGYGGIRSFQQFQVASDVGVRLVYALDRRALGVGLVVAIVSALLASFVPAWRAAGMNDVSGTLRNARGPAARKSGLWGKGLVAAQVALTLLVLTVAAGFYRAFEAEYSAGPGFRTSNILLVSLNPALARYDDEKTDAFYRLLKERVRGMPGVTTVGLSSFVPLSQSASDGASIVPEGYTMAVGASNIPMPAARIDESYLDTIGIAIVRGRGFAATDTVTSPRVAIVSRATAARYWPGADPVGRRFRLDKADGPSVEVIGVAADTKYRLFTPSSADFVYLPRAQNPIPRSTLLVGVSGSAATLAGPVSDAVRALDPAMPVQSMRTMEDYYYASARNFNTVTVRTVAGMGVAGLVLALAGLYGLVAYAVSRRTREIGIRMALGAVPQSMLRMVLWHGWLPTAAGMLAGVLLSAAAGRLLRSAFQGGAGIDAGSYLLVVPAVLVVVTAAAYVPARRAARLDPLVALRQD
jgi:predicted permease